MSRDLKPCPFCGETENHLIGEDTDGEFPSFGYVFCATCGASGPSSANVSAPTTLDGARIAWNRRAPNEQSSTRASLAGYNASYRELTGEG